MKEYFYEVHLSQESGRKGRLTAHDIQEIETISVAVPFKEKKKRWTPEQLLAGSVSACFMTDYLECAEKRNLEVLNYQSHCFVKIEKTPEGYVTTAILLRPIVTLQHGRDVQSASLCTEEAEKYCAMQHLLRIPIHVHVQFEYASVPSDSK